MSAKYKKVIIFRSTHYDHNGKVSYTYYADKDFAIECGDSYNLTEVAIRVPINTNKITLHTTK